MIELESNDTINVSGGIFIPYEKIAIGALSSAAIKTGAHYIEISLPKGEKDTFMGEVWNGLAKGIASFGSTMAIGIACAYIVTAVQRYPAGEDQHRQ